jgi:hypothetical protein
MYRQIMKNEKVKMKNHFSFFVFHFSITYMPERKPFSAGILIFMLIARWLLPLIMY